MFNCFLEDKKENALLSELIGEDTMNKNRLVEAGGISRLIPRECFVVKCSRDPASNSKIDHEMAYNYTFLKFTFLQCISLAKV